jgi:eukaryotic-like serine/threonine-protein kinase
LPSYVRSPFVMIGQVLGHYRVIEKIGAGGMGDVYRASDDGLGREVALKFLKASLASDPDRLRRFEQEARATAALNHPNIVAVHGIGMHDGAPYIVSELLQGQTLRQRMTEGSISVRQADEFGIQIAQGLVAAHEKHIIHRDLKPENIFITHDNRIKILDFGIAKLAAPRAIEGDAMVSMTTQTKIGAVLGTIGYMSPEQLRARPVDHRSDIFSFGAILYEVLTGKRAFHGDTEVDTMMAVLQEDPQEMIEMRQGVPIAFEQIVRHCLEKDPEDRFQTARDLAFALGTVSNASTGKHNLACKTRGKVWRKWLPWATAAVLLAMLGVVLGERLKPALVPAYQRVSFERGTIYAARFAPDGRGTFYSASWNGEAIQIYSTVENSPLSRPLGFESASLLGLSKSSEMALVLHGTHGSRLDFVNGMLARAPLAGGAPREVLQDVRWADWSPSGELAVVHHANGRSRLEFPVGHVLYETQGWISHIRFSPQGNSIAFMNHPALWDDRGAVDVVDLNGAEKVLSSGWESEDGLAWSPQGNEIWFTAAESSATGRTLWAVDLAGHRRKILGTPGGLELQDIAADGRVLATTESERLAMEWSGEGDQKVQDLSWYDWTVAKDISSDGQWVLFEESSEPAGPNYAVATRKINGAPPIRLGDGSAESLSPDGNWALSIFSGTPQHITLLPVGAGQARQIYVPDLAHLQNSSAHYLPDGKRIVVIGNEPNRPARTYVIDITGGKPRAVTPEGVYATMPSPDGKYLCGADSSAKLGFYPVDGGEPRIVPLPEAGLMASQWSADSKSLYVYRAGEVPLKVYRMEIDSGKMTLVRQLVPADTAGVVTISPVVTNYKGTQFAYSYYQTLSALYVISGLK